MFKHARFYLFFSLVIALGVFVVDAAVFTAAFSSLVPRANAQTVTTYYIDYTTGNDTNTGTSQTSPWKHAPGDSSATGNAGATALKAGDTALFKGGVRYTGKININWSGSSGTYITYDGNSSGSWGVGKAIMDGKNSPTDNVAFIANSAKDYITIKGFEIVDYGGYPDGDPVFSQTCANPSNVDRSGTGISFWAGGSHLVFKDLYIHEIGVWYNQAPFTGNAINGTGIGLRDNNDVMIDTVEFTRMFRPILLRSMSSISNIEIKNVDIHNYIVWGIDVSPGASNAAIENISIHDSKIHDMIEHDLGNWWSNCGSSFSEYYNRPHTDGIFLRRDYHPIIQTTPVLIYNNTFYNTNIGNSDGGTASIHVTEGPSASIYNNLFIGTKDSPTIYLHHGNHPGSSPQYLRIYNNSFFNDHTAVDAVTRPESPFGFISIKNNVFYDTRNSGVVNAGLTIFLETVDSIPNELDYNLYYSSLGASQLLFRWDGGGGEYTLAGLRSQKGFEMHGIQANPQYVTTSYGLRNPSSLLNDLHLQSNSPAKGAGQGGVDMGAYGGNGSPPSGGATQSSGGSPPRRHPKPAADGFHHFSGFRI